MSTAVIVPWRGGCEHRERTLSFVLDRYTEQHPDWTAVVAEHNDGPWCKALAVTPAVQAVSADVLVVADADVWCTGLSEAVQHVEHGAPWAIPHAKVHRLTERASEAFMSDIVIDELAEPAYTGYAGGGIVVLPRSTYLAVPLDPRFIGWGQEDEAWATALHCLHGPAWRGGSPLWHLWHPPQARKSRRTGSVASDLLRRRYWQARRSPRSMRSLLEEVTVCPGPA